MLRQPNGCLTDREARSKVPELRKSGCLLKQKKENKLSTTFESVPHNVSGRYGSEIVVTSPEGVNYRRNVTDVKKYLREAATTAAERQATGHYAIEGGVTRRVAKPSVRPTTERKPPEYLNDYEVYRLG